MRSILALWHREIRAFSRSPAQGLALAAFLLASGWTFTMALHKNEGGMLQLQTIWSVTVAPWLPIFSALLTMRLFAEERATGSIELLLATPMRERHLVYGKYAAALTLLSVALGLTLLPPLLVLPLLSPVNTLPGQFFSTFLPTLGFLTLQGAAWCAIGTLSSILMRSATAAVITSLILCCGLPLAIYMLTLNWLPQLRDQVAWFPLLMHVYDASTGLFSSAVIFLYSAIIATALFITAKLLLLLRIR